MRSFLGLAAAAALGLAPAFAAAPADRISAEVKSCEAFPGAEGTRVVLVRVRAGTSGVRNPDVRCGAASASDHVLGWSRVRGLDEIAAGEAREAMVLVPADAAHDACRCVVAESREALCAPWQALENGRCVEPAGPR